MVSDHVAFDYERGQYDALRIALKAIADRNLSEDQ